MNAPTFDAHSSSCPICRRSSACQSTKLLTGLLICQRCQERLVISWSGHYVRDPFHLQQLNLERSLRRESHPIHRIIRDLKLNHPNAIAAILTGVTLLGLAGVFADNLSSSSAQSSQSSLLHTQ